MRSILIVMVLCAAGVRLTAAEISVGFPPEKYGNLDQHKTNCPNLACGPTAAVNSFVFLQNLDPFTYGSSLVPAHGGDPLNPTPTEEDEIGVANLLLGSSYMNTDCAKCGTYWGRFILGKENYIEKMKPGVTDYKAQSRFAWDPALAGTPAKPIAKPAGVDDNMIPTIDFIIAELAAGEDVEVLLQCPDVSPCAAGHYLTVTGVTWDAMEMIGKLSFIDPSTGKPDTKDISQAGDEPIFIDYPGGLNNIDVVVSESAKITLFTPEPVTLAMAALVLFILGLMSPRKLKKTRLDGGDDGNIIAG